MMEREHSYKTNFKLVIFSVNFFRPFFDLNAEHAYTQGRLKVLQCISHTTKTHNTFEIYQEIM